MWKPLARHNAATMFGSSDQPPTNLLEAILALLRWLGKLLQWLSF